MEVPGVRFETPAGEKAKRSFTDISYAGAAISAANKVRIKPGRGRSREELIRDAIERGGLTQEELAEYEQELAAMRLQHGVVASPTVVGQARAPQNQQKEGFNVTNSVGGGTEVVDLGGTGGAADETVVESEGIKFTTTNGPKKGVRLVDKAPPQKDTSSGEAHDSVCRKIAKAICADFPDNYVFTQTTRKKIARLQADFEDRPDVIRAVAAADTDPEVRNRLFEEFPEAFK